MISNKHKQISHGVNKIRILEHIFKLYVYTMQYKVDVDVDIIALPSCCFLVISNIM